VVETKILFGCLAAKGNDEGLSCFFLRLLNMV